VPPSHLQTAVQLHPSNLRGGVGAPPEGSHAIAQRSVRTSAQGAQAAGGELLVRSTEPRWECHISSWRSRRAALASGWVDSSDTCRQAGWHLQ